MRRRLAILVLAATCLGLAFSCPPAPAGEKPAAGQQAQVVLVAAHLTDIHLRPEFNAPDRFRAALHHLRTHYPEVSLVLNTGDVIDGAKTRDDMARKLGFWKAATEAELQGITIRSLLGNHDKLDKARTDDPQYGKAALCAILGMPRRYYSFDQAGWHFLMLDGTVFGSDKEQQDWLDKELKTVDPKTPIAVLSHQPIFSMGGTIHSPGDQLAGWKGLIAKFVGYPNVRLCLSGHTHLYDECRYNGVTYVCGGAVSGYWWEYAKSTDGKSAYHETRPGYGIVRFHADGAVEYQYVPHEAAP